MAHKLSEIKDFPYSQKVKIYGVGSILGEECMISDNQKYSTSVICVSSQGAIMKIHKKNLLLVKNSRQAWASINKRVIEKEKRI